MRRTPPRLRLDKGNPSGFPHLSPLPELFKSVAGGEDRCPAPLLVPYRRQPRRQPRPTLPPPRALFPRLPADTSYYWSDLRRRCDHRRRPATSKVCLFTALFSSLFAPLCHLAGGRQAAHSPCRGLPPPPVPIGGPDRWPTGHLSFPSPVGARRSAGRGPMAPATPSSPLWVIGRPTGGRLPPVTPVPVSLPLSVGRGWPPAASRLSAGAGPCLLVAVGKGLVPAVSWLSAGAQPLPLQCCWQGLSPCRFVAVGRAGPLPSCAFGRGWPPLPLQCCWQGLSPCRFVAVGRGWPPAVLCFRQGLTPPCRFNVGWQGLSPCRFVAVGRGWPPAVSCYRQGLSPPVVSWLSAGAQPPAASWLSAGAQPLLLHCCRQGLVPPVTVLFSANRGTPLLPC